ncbi:MAG: homoserine dehydrogenase [Myxococcales bacterium]|nr:homoserine dehydrogenase [Myxococcales bacterium]MCB9708911.1 homoserine dehydrogenase [Myxococcales bacterium]
MARSIGIALLGCGVVGKGVLWLLRHNREALRAKLGAELHVRHVVVRNPEKHSAVEAPVMPSADLAKAVADPAVDMVVELIGGIDPARELIERALTNGKSVVTANKAVIADHGHSLIAAAERSKQDLYFEAAVAGGVPILRVLRETLCGDRVLAIRGIVNGTSNYMLSKMHKERIDFAQALKEAQQAGYAEADPTLDIGGGDAAHKLAILATIAFGAHVSVTDITTEGIERIAAIDMLFADRFGYVIKHLAIARLTEHGSLDLRVHPTLVDADADLASIHGALNAVHIEAEALGPSLLSGYGAGSLPTAVSVLGDMVDVGRNILSHSTGRVPPWGIALNHLARIPVEPMGEHRGCYYLRFSALDHPGVLARITGILGQHQVSIEQIVQEGRAREAGSPVPVVILTHQAKERDVEAALQEIDMLDSVAQPAHRLRIMGT